MTWPPLVVDLPAWVAEVAPVGAALAPGERMGLVLDLALRNVVEGTGGPFAAAVFESASGRLLGPGVNVVVPSSVPVAHAEIVALALAGRVTGSYDLGSGSELVTSTEPCTMCFGACLWSGIGTLVTGATTADAEAVGFDEGPKPPDWAAELRRRGITVVTGRQREAAAAVLAAYAAAGGPIYNGSRGAGPGHSRGGSHV